MKIKKKKNFFFGRGGGGWVGLRRGGVRVDVY